MTDRYTPEANAAIEQLQAAGLDYAEADMIYHGDMLGPALGSKTATLITSLREALEPFIAVVPHYEGVKDDYLVIRHVGESGDHTLNVVDFRRARTALNPSRKETI